jgi:hypothetical protein
MEDIFTIKKDRVDGADDRIRVYLEKWCAVFFLRDVLFSKI